MFADGRKPLVGNENYYPQQVAADDTHPPLGTVTATGGETLVYPLMILLVRV
jgi:hypothetical protein